MKNLPIQIINIINLCLSPTASLYDHCNLTTEEKELILIEPVQKHQQALFQKG